MIVPCDDFEVSPVVRLVISDNWHYSTVYWIHTDARTRGEGGSRGAFTFPAIRRADVLRFIRVTTAQPSTSEHSRVLSLVNDVGFEGEK